MENREKYYVTYIAASAEQIWVALTEPESCRTFFFGRWMESDWTVGSGWRLMKGEGVDSSGKVLECMPPHKLSVSWKSEEMPELPTVIVTIEIEKKGEVCKLTVWEAHEESASEDFRDGGRSGWPLILSGLKTLLETGRPLATSR